jgi:Mg2+ and Co2+ transporter CorA
LEAPSSFDIDTRDSYTTSLLHYLHHNPNLRTRNPVPVAILQDLHRIIASEWITVNAYVERDLNAIEWRLERDRPDIATLDFFLEQLFIMRRRTRKYEILVTDHLGLNIPFSWRDSAPSPIEEDLEQDYHQVQDIIRRNNERITQTVALITSLMSIIEGKRATSINQRLAFLTVLATIALPFNVFAAIFGVQTEYGPGQARFWVLVVAAAGTIALVLLCYACFLLLPRMRASRIRDKML